MLNSFSPEGGSDLAHSLFDSIVGLLELCFFFIEYFEVVGLCDNDLRGAIKLASEVRDCPNQSFHVRNGFFAPLPPQPCPHGFSLAVFPSVVLPKCSLISHLPGVKACVHLFLSVVIALVVGIMFVARDFRDEPFWSFADQVVAGPSHLLGSLPSPVASGGRRRQFVFSISW